MTHKQTEEIQASQDLNLVIADPDQTPDLGET